MALHNAIRLDRVKNYEKFFHMKGTFVTINDEKHDSPKHSCNLGEIIWPDSYGSTRQFYDLEIWSQGDTDCERKYYSWEIRYKGVYSVDLRQAEMMAKTLKGMESRLTKYAEKHGRALTVADYFLAVALTNKVKYFVKNNPPDRTLGFERFEAIGANLHRLDSFSRFE